MPAAILSIIGPMIPYILGILAVIGIYLGVKQKGVQQERQRQQVIQQKAQAQVQKKIEVAQSKDIEIDNKATEAKDEVVKNVEKPSTGDLPPGSQFKF